LAFLLRFKKWPECWQISCGVFVFLAILFFVFFFNLGVTKYDQAEKSFSSEKYYFTFDYYDGYYFSELEKDDENKEYEEIISVNFPDECFDGSESYKFKIIVYGKNSRKLIEEAAKRNLGWPWTRRFIDWDNLVEMLADDGFVAGGCYSKFDFYDPEYFCVAQELENYFAKMGVRVEFHEPEVYLD
jgi:hypothetical protein